MKKTIFIVITSFILFLAVLGGIKGYRYYRYCNQNPDIKLLGDETITLNLGEEYQELGAESVFKAKDISDTIETTGSVDTSKVGEYEITYTTKSRNKKQATIKRHVKVIDNVNPEITLKGDANLSIYVNQEYNEAGYTASDNYDGDVTDKVVTSGNVNTKEKGTYEIIYSVTDSSNNTFSVSRIVNVKERPQVTSSNKNTRGLPVLMYHFFYDDTAGGIGHDANWMSTTSFDAQMKYLSDNNFYFPTWQEVEDYVNGRILLPEKSVVITIDDGDITFIEHAIPIIEKYNVHATSFAVTVWTGESLAEQYKNNSKNLSIQSHSYDAHKSGANGKGLLVNMTYEQVLNDATKSRDLTNNSTVFCYPFGHYNDTVIQALEAANYHLAFTTRSGRVFPNSNPYTLPRVRISKDITLSDFISKVS